MRAVACRWLAMAQGNDDGFFCVSHRATAKLYNSTTMARLLMISAALLVLACAAAALAADTPERTPHGRRGATRHMRGAALL